MRDYVTVTKELIDTIQKRQIFNPANKFAQKSITRLKAKEIELRQEQYEVQLSMAQRVENRNGVTYAYNLCGCIGSTKGAFKDCPKVVQLRNRLDSKKALSLDWEDALKAYAAHFLIENK